MEAGGVLARDGRLEGVAAVRAVLVQCTEESCFPLAWQSFEMTTGCPAIAPGLARPKGVTYHRLHKERGSCRLPCHHCLLPHKAKRNHFVPAVQSKQRCNLPQPLLMQCCQRKGRLGMVWELARSEGESPGEAWKGLWRGRECMQKVGAHTPCLWRGF